jgi:hypothetical protein
MSGQPIPRHACKNVEHFLGAVIIHTGYPATPRSSLRQAQSRSHPLQSAHLPPWRSLGIRLSTNGAPARSGHLPARALAAINSRRLLLSTFSLILLIPIYW